MSTWIAVKNMNTVVLNFDNIAISHGIIDNILTLKLALYCGTADIRNIGNGISQRDKMCIKVTKGC